jgi:dihydrolipoamide dehydrogenase
MQKYDVTVIGAGPGGYVAAIRAAQRGAATAVIEKDFLGGTCLNWGCIPTKSLISAAELLWHITHAGSFGIRIEGKARPDWPAILQRKNETVLGLRNGIAALLKSNGVDVIQGTASFAGRHQIQVRQENGVRDIETGATIIATGSESVQPGFIPQAANILYSRQALDNPILPGKMLILGGGVIGCEFACMYAQLGVSVTLVEMLPEILPFQDSDVARTVRRSMEKMGITILTGTRMADIEADGKRVKAAAGNTKLTADQLLVCIGRRPYLDGLQLDMAGLTPDDQGLLSIDARCQTKVPSIYAIGDITGGLQYAHRASAMGICAANNATGLRDSHRDDLVPGCIFTTPQIGCVGMTEQEAKNRDIPVRVGKFPFAALGKAQILQQTEGFCKLIADAETDQVLGAHIVGPDATNLIAEVATAMNLEITAEELGRAMHAHPTLAEASMEAAHAVHDQCIHLPKPRKRN